jgi:hypothetical protein
MFALFVVGIALSRISLLPMMVQYGPRSHVYTAITYRAFDVGQSKTIATA